MPVRKDSTFNMIDAGKKSLSDHLETYLERHGVKQEMDTNYLLDVFTVKIGTAE